MASKINVKLDLDAASKAALEEKLKALKAKINVTLNVSAAEKARIRAEIEAISPTIDIRLRYNRSEIEALIRQLRDARGEVRGFGGDSDRAFGGMNGQVRGVMALLPALLPIAASAINGIVGLLGAGTSAVGLFGTAFGSLALVAVPAFKRIKDAVAGGLVEINKLPPGLREAALALQNLESRFEMLQEATNKSVGGMFVQAFKAAELAIKPLAPLINTTADALGRGAIQAQKFFASPEYQKFVDFVRANIAPAVEQLVSIVINGTKSIMNLTQAFWPLASWILDKINVGLRQFAAWTSKLQSDPAFQQWLEGVKVSLEKWWTLLTNVVQFLWKLIQDLKPLGDKMVDFLNMIFDALNKLPPGWLGAIAMGLGGVVAGLLAFGTGPVGAVAAVILGVAGALSVLYDSNEKVRKALDTLVAWLKAEWQPIWDTIKTNFETKIKPAFDALVTTIQDHLIPVFAAWKKGYDDYIKPWLVPLADTITGQLIPAFLDFLNAVAPLWLDFWKTMGPIIEQVLGAVLGIVDGALKAISGVFTAATGLLTGDWTKFGDGLRTIAEGFWTAVAAIFGTNLDGLKAKYQEWDAAITNAWNTFWDGFKSRADGGSTDTQNAWTVMLDGIRSYLDTKSTEISTAWDQFWQTFTQKTNTGGEDNRSAMGRAFDALTQIVTDAGNSISSAWTSFWNGFSQTTNDFLNNVQQRFSEFGPWCQQRIQEAANGIGQAWKAVANFFAEPINWVINVVMNQGILSAWNQVMGWIGAPGLSASPIAQIPTYATGGWISGPGTGTSDSVPALLSSGEFVVRQSVASQAGGFLEALNAGVMRFANGGPVPPVPPGGQLATGQAGATTAPGTTAQTQSVSWWSQVGDKATALFNSLKNYSSMPRVASAIGSAIAGSATALIDRVLDTLKTKLTNMFTTIAAAATPPAVPGAENLSPAGVDPRLQGPFDKGGILRSGFKPLNTSGHAERVLSPKQTQDFDQLIKILNDMFHPTKTKSPTGGDIYHITLPKGATVRELANEIGFRKKVSAKGRYSPR